MKTTGPLFAAAYRADLTMSGKTASQPQGIASMEDSFTLAVTGQSLIKHDLRNIQAPGFEQVKSILRSADLSFTNFEGTILGAHGGWPLKGSYFGCSDPVVLDCLQDIGFGALGLSNNHAFDLGPSGILSTLEEVTKRGFLHGGIGLNLTDVSAPRVKIFQHRPIGLVAMDGGPGPDIMYAANGNRDRPDRPGVNRLKLSQIIDVDPQAFDQLLSVRDRVGYTKIDLTNDSQPDDPPLISDEEELGLARGIFRRSNAFGRSVRIDPSDLSRNLAAIRTAAQRGGHVIAYLHHHHWASDWYQVPAWVAAVAKQCIDAGAALFLSHGAPVLQPIEIYKGRPIFYSLGNFIFHVRSEKSNWTAPEVWESVVATCAFSTEGHVHTIMLHPIVIGGEDALADPVLEHRLVPQYATGQAADRILRRLASQSAPLGVEIEISGGIGRIPLDMQVNGAVDAVLSSA